MSRLHGKKMAEDKTRARTMARAQAVAEKLSTATEQVAAAINEATRCQRGRVQSSCCSRAGDVRWLLHRLPLELRA